MRHLPAVLLLAVFAGACDTKSEQPAPGSGAIAPAVKGLIPAENAEQTCTNAACETACKDVRADIRDDCPMAFEAGCFDGSAPSDFPCKLFLEVPAAAPAAAQEETQEVNFGDGARRIEATPKLKRIAPEKRTKSEEIDVDDEPQAKPTPLGD